MEIWKQIENFEGYFVSNFGRIKAEEIITAFGNQTKTHPERYLNVWRTPNGYNYIDVSVDGNVKRFSLHRLVALYFIPNPENKPQVNHIDGDKDNNNDWNLEWCTAAENLKHARDLGLNNSIGSYNKMAKFSPQQILDIRKSKETVTNIAAEYNVSLAIISRIRSLKSYKNVI